MEKRVVLFVFGKYERVRTPRSMSITSMTLKMFSAVRKPAFVGK